MHDRLGAWYGGAVGTRAVDRDRVIGIVELVDALWSKKGLAT